MEVQPLGDTGYERFLEFGRHLAQLQAAVYDAFGMPIPSASLQDASISDAWDSYLELPASYSEDKVISDIHLHLHDKVLDFVSPPAEMDWEDFSELVWAVIEYMWQRLESRPSDRMELVLSSV